MAHVVELELAGRRLRLETGRVAKQADGVPERQTRRRFPPADR
jgi:hypothetical protein